MKYLLDTHILLWWFEGSNRLSPKVKKLIKQKASHPLVVSDITLWEVSMLYALGRVCFDRPLREWFEMATAPPLIELQRITPAIAATVSTLPSNFQRDPADRVLVSTALVIGAKLVTSDREIIESGLVETIKN